MISTLYQAYKEYVIFFGIFFSLYIVYLIIGMIITHSQLKNDQKRRAFSNLRAIFFLFMLSTFLYLWAHELQQFILSIAAILAALAIAFKEFFLCLAGYFYRTFSHPFSVGDRIQVTDFRGDVVNVGLLTTQLLEVGPNNYTHQYTGRMLAIPNSLFISHPILNETDNVHDDDKDYALHVFKVPIKNNKNWTKHYKQILDCANTICKEHIEPAQKYFHRLARKRHVDSPDIEPRINVRVSNSEQLELIVRVTVPVALKGRVEQKILKDYLNKIHTEA
ncbi:MAG: hypothetical protein CME62_09125 [Halobacteriovoraceae bacterium]|nr:hypothetical protein [Halobacteriovoraceae bacterium]|tara:strand:+ start:10627 stop:11457 length:831 start_codon:yes stop_codon:yes gene_type:complete